jgi:hypothetical protein
MQQLFKSALVILLAVGVVAIGAEELRRTTGKIKVTEESGHRMMGILNPNRDFSKGQLAERAKQEELNRTEKAQLKEQASAEEKEQLDPTGLRSLLNTLLPETGINFKTDEKQ